MEMTEFTSEKASRPKQAYTWEVPGKPVSIQIDFDVVERLGSEVMRGFGAVPRRGLEIGGILLGTAEKGKRLEVRIEDFEPVLSTHASGPSYVIGEEDRDRFAKALERWKAAPGRRLRAVGFYRSHTREGLSLSPEDVELLDKYFPEETAIALLVKPFATRASVAGFFFREEGVIRSESSYREFPFRRAELGGGERHESFHPSSSEHASHGSSDAGREGFSPGGSILGLGDPGPAERRESPPDPANQEPVSPRARSLRLRGGWVWVPLSFIFLLLGTVLGFQVALSVQSKITATPRQDPYRLSLSATPSAGSIHVRWDRASPVIQKAQRGVLVITENSKQKSVALDAGYLRNGSVIYRRASDNVRFRLEVFTSENVSVCETISYQPVTAKSNPGESGG